MIYWKNQHYALLFFFSIFSKYLYFFCEDVQWKTNLWCMSMLEMDKPVDIRKVNIYEPFIGRFVLRCRPNDQTYKVFAVIWKKLTLMWSVHVFLKCVIRFSDVSVFGSRFVRNMFESCLVHEWFQTRPRYKWKGMEKLKGKITLGSLVLFILSWESTIGKWKNYLIHYSCTNQKFKKSCCISFSQLFAQIKNQMEQNVPFHVDSFVSDLVWVWSSWLLCVLLWTVVGLLVFCQMGNGVMENVVLFRGNKWITVRKDDMETE